MTYISIDFAEEHNLRNPRHFVVPSAAGPRHTPHLPLSFDFPYLSESKTAIAYLQSRNIAIFAPDIDSLDYRTRHPQTVVRRVMALLERRGRGIILFHDIHASRAAALPALLVQLKAKGFKVVHLSPKAPAQTNTEYQPPAPNMHIKGHRPGSGRLE